MAAPETSAPLCCGSLPTYPLFLNPLQKSDVACPSTGEALVAPPPPRRRNGVEETESRTPTAGLDVNAMPLFGKSSKNPVEVVKSLREAVNALEKVDKKAEKAGSGGRMVTEGRDWRRRKKLEAVGAQLIQAQNGFKCVLLYLPNVLNHPVPFTPPVESGQRQCYCGGGRRRRRKRQQSRANTLVSAPTSSDIPDHPRSDGPSALGQAGNCAV
ncbi:protein Mo25-like [Tropilaelaps mercedesae]|uniref:Protein Mo25-like n=1 Tax=Tropilaelaps mercedesae TaxID=418985 RepID=A0A1V9X3N8_9ACAR|nr:protein Mo25-like [Tropilaelaps mercedesae]